MKGPHTITLHPLEFLPVGLYLILLLYLGFRKKFSWLSEEDFIVGGRYLTLPAFVATLVTTWYGGILGVGEFSYLYGLSNWLVFGVPYYIFGVVFAFVLAPKIRKAELYSIPDQFFKNYGRSNGFLGAFFAFFMTLPAPYVLMLGLLISATTGLPLLLCLVLGTLFSFAYVISGGFRAVVRTDKLQFLLMFGGFAVTFLILLNRFGGIEFLRTKLPPTHLTWHGGNSWEYILVWFFIASWTFIDPGFHQRCYAAKTPAVAKKGILVSVLFWIVFDFLTTSTGLYARALLSHIPPTLSYPILSHQVLPPLLSGIFLTGLLATIMSTIDSFTLLSAITIGHDILKKIFPQKNPVRYIQWGLVVTAVSSVLVAYYLPSVIQIWYVIGSLFIPPMLLPVLGSYLPVFRMTPFFVRLNLILAFSVSAAFFSYSAIQSQSLVNIRFLGNIQPMYPGLLVSLFLYGAATLVKHVQNGIEKRAE